MSQGNSQPNINLKKVGGTATDTNSGVKSAGTLRVVIATDQPALTNKLLVTPDLPSGAATSALQSTQDTSINTLLKPANTLAGVTTVSTVTNLSQMGGAAIAMGTGLRSAGTQRVTIATDDSVPVTGTFWQATQPVSGTVSITANSAVNVAQINGVTPLMGNGVTGTGSQRVTIASDNTAFSVNSTLSAETTKVIGTVRTADGAGNLLTTNSTTYTAKFGLDSNLLGTKGTAFTTAGFVDIKGADGDVFVRQATASNLNAQVVGNIAHDGVDSGNPIKVGHKAIAHGTNPTAVAAADRTDWYANRAGVPFVIGGHPNIVTFEAAYTAAQTDAAIVTIAGGLKIVVTEIEALCDNANTVDVGVRVGFGTTTTPTTTGVVLTHPGIAAGSGVIRGNGSGIVGVGADGEDLRITCEAPTTGSIRILVSYYTIES